MSFLTIASCLLVFVYDCSAVDIMPELKKNILNFGYGMLIIITLGMLYLVTNKIRKTSFCKGCLFSNNTKILLFISNAHSYVPIKLCRVAGIIHLFQIKGRLNPENVKCKKNWIWDVLEIDWSDVSITLNDNEINSPR